VFSEGDGVPFAKRYFWGDSMEKEIFLIVGLGNPGEKYAHTRHNAGFEAADRLAKRWGVTLKKKLLLPGMTAEIAEAGKKIVLCEPTTFMNNSGECVKRLMAKYNAAPDHLMVIYDDIDLPPARIRVRKNGGPGTHNGMRSIVEKTGITDFPRIRIGTGDRPAGQDLAEWVLSRYTREEQPAMEEAFDRAAEAAVNWVEHGIDYAMNHAGKGT
jgi:PTH1 family peptidyl-tRNA hydrolase